MLVFANEKVYHILILNKTGKALFYDGKGKMRPRFNVQPYGIYRGYVCRKG